MSLEDNKAIVRRFVEAYNKRNLDLLDDLVAPDGNYKVWKASNRALC
jgi:hypothetical protein